MSASRKVGRPIPGSRTDLGTRLRELEKRFRNRAEAASAAGVARSTFQNWVEGKSDPSFEGLARCAVAAGVSLDWLAYGSASNAEEHMHKESVQSPIDNELLEIIIDVLDKELRRRTVSLKADRKAFLISELYGLCMEARNSGIPVNSDPATRVWLNGFLRIEIGRDDRM